MSRAELNLHPVLLSWSRTAWRPSNSFAKSFVTMKSEIAFSTVRAANHFFAPMKLEIHAMTHPRLRPTNEDAVLAGGSILTGRSRRTYGTIVPEEGVLLAVADGVSGAPCAALASRRVLRELKIQQARKGELRPAVLRAVQVTMAQEAANSPCFGMAACVAAILVTPSHAALLHAGDCRIYRGRHGVLDVQTADHSAGAGMLLRGDASSFSGSGHASIYSGAESAVIADSGEADFEIGWKVMNLVAGDLFLLTTDGAHGAFSLLEETGHVSALLDATTTPERVAAIGRLHAMSRDINTDNSSLILVRVFD